MITEIVLATGRLIALAVLLQTFELWAISEWKWSIQSQEFSAALRPLGRAYRPLLIVRALAAAVALWAPELAAPAFVLIFTTWIVAIRWRGTFNGGSDGMTMVILMAWAVARAWPEMASIALWYIAVQAAVSYAVAGFVKLKSAEWRRGTALAHFMKRPVRRGDFVISWLVMLFEFLFPLALFSPRLGLVFMGTGVVFHLINSYTLGLNRFFFAWLAAYPAVYWASLHFQ